MDSELEPTERLDRLALSIQQEIGSSATIVQEAVADSLVSAYIEQGIKAANEESVSRAAKVQVSLLGREGREEEYGGVCGKGRV